jgi:hypothetical protein
MKLTYWIYNRLLDLSDRYIGREHIEEEFLAELHESDGFQSYLASRDLAILKAIAIAIEKRDFHSSLELNGRRYELLRLAAKAKEEHLKHQLKPTA